MDSELASGSQAADPSCAPENLVKSDSYGEVGYLAVASDTVASQNSGLALAKFRAIAPRIPFSAKRNRAAASHNGVAWRPMALSGDAGW